VLLVVFTMALLALASWWLVSGLKHDMASARIADAAQLVSEEVKRLIVPVERQLLIARDGLLSEGTEPDNRAALDARFIPTLRHMEQISGAIYADGTGSEYFLLREEDGWLVRERPPGTSGLASWTRMDHQREIREQWEAPLDYDPRARSWYENTLDPASSGVSWSDPYVFHSLQVPGITASIAWESGGKKRVAALDIVLESIVDAMERLSLGKQGTGLLFSDAGGIYAPGSDPKTQPSPDREQFFSAQERFGGPLLVDAVSAWRNADRPAEDMVRFASGGKDWWGGFRPLSDRARSAWVGVVIPASTTAGILQSRWLILVLNAVLILALGVGLAAILMRKYSRQLRDLPKLSIDRRDPERDLYDLIGGGEDTHLELKSTMRTNLHTNKPGKEIELAWLKGMAAFMNTEGGILLIGVADDGAVLGLEPDGFENDDKCRLHFKNLLNQHLGAEYARNVRFDLHELGGKQVAAVECERSDTPVFLRHKKGEHFLIRNGPSNIELSLSRALKYIRGRF
jgi:hypothetical protein